MTEKTRQGIKVIEAALLLGVLGDGLLRATPWGLNVLLWAGALVIALVVLLARWRRSALSAGGHWPLLTAVLFAAAFAWRDSATLNFLAGAGLLTSLALVAWRARGGRLWLASLGEYALGLLAAGVEALCCGFPLLLGDVRWRELPAAGWSRHLKAIMRGLVIALPLLVLFCGLFAAADAAFGRMFSGLVLADYSQVLGHFALALCLMWLSGGFLRSALLGRRVGYTPEGRATLAVPHQAATGAPPATPGVQSFIAPQTLKSEPFALGIVEIGVVLGLLNLVFLTFVILQLPYLFGGAALVQDAGGWTYAEYYRRGFFELVTVAVLVLPVLLGAHKLLRKENPAHERIYRVLAGVQVVLLFVVMASAVRRMLLYQREYGLTELRLYTTAFIAWLGLVFVWFILTVLRGRREQFACGALVAALLMTGALHVINPDALIVSVNEAHARAGRGFDAPYAVTLSADAIPALLQALPAMAPEDRRYVASRLLAEWAKPGGADWRTWNWSRSQSSRAMRESMEELRALADSLKIEQMNETLAPVAAVMTGEVPSAATAAEVSSPAKPLEPPAGKPRSLTPQRGGHFTPPRSFRPGRIGSSKGRAHFR